MKTVSNLFKYAEMIIALIIIPFVVQEKDGDSSFKLDDI